MAVAAFLMAVLALAVSIASLVYSRRQVHASEREAEAAHRQDLRERKPNLVVELVEFINEGDIHAPYRVRLEGPEDLDSVVVLRPKMPDGVVYSVAPLGGDFGDEAALGRLELGHDRSFLIAVGSRSELPQFRVRIVARRGGDEWEESVLLDPPRSQAVVAFV